MELYKEIYFKLDCDFIPAAYYVGRREQVKRENQKLKELLELTKQSFLTLPQKIILKAKP
tara:strand:- start:6870 stop:7049 length:180 start_codon:yes stop_codon:yes gene_type:complete